MERFTQGRIVMLGYSPPSSVPKTPLKNSDVDFHDVFGGPPRRYSIHEMQHRYSETMDSSTGLSETPVIGEESENHRRYTSDDFFDDIFRGGGSPRSPSRDPCCSAPASRVLSPARPLPSKAEPFGSALPAPFSLPAKLTKAMEFAAFDPGNCRPYKYKDGISNGISFPYAPSGSRFSSKKIEGQDESRNHIPPSYRQSPLSHEFSLSREEPSCINKVNETKIGGNLKKDSNSEETASNSNQFHFSIYKWASKGVPLLMPLRGRNSSKSRETGKIDRCSSSNGRIQRDNAVCELPRANVCDIDSVFLNRSTPANIESCKMDGKKQDNDSLLKKCFQNILEPCQIVEEAVLAMPESQFLDSFECTFENLADDVTLSDERKEMKPLSLSKIGLCGKTEKENYVFIQEARKPDLKPLQSLFNGYSEKQGNNEITRNDEGKESTVKIIKVSNSNVDATENRKKYDVKRNNSNRAEVNTASLQGPPIKSGDTFGRNGVQGKVKEFVKIFNQDASSKPKINADIGSRRSRWRGTGTYGADNEASVRTTGTDGKLQNKLKTLPDTSFMVDQNLEQLEKQHSQMKTIHKMSNNSSGQKDASASISESLLDCSKDTLGNIDDPFEENFLIKELSHDQDKLQQTVKDYEDIQVSDVKIQQWSKGKEENIRSLLSTLQCVLWPESGWKPVPLVNVIEGSAVKRAYQKALLCLHPDKLQQKGAASHQKYIAEKVFDILQGAWDHFNSLSSL